MDDKMGLARSPSRHPLQDTGLDIQATQAGVSCLPCPLPALPSACPVPPMLGPWMPSCLYTSLLQPSCAQPVALALLHLVLVQLACLSALCS